MTFLFDKIIFGPVKSRRLGISLGINLLPTTRKICNFNCIYCECGWTPKNVVINSSVPIRNQVRQALEQCLIEMTTNHQELNSITYAGNGEPTLHPHFSEIIDDTIRLRDQYFPHVKISVLSNATLIHKPAIYAALKKIDNNILKLDSGFATTIQLINKPIGHFNLEKLVANLLRYQGDLIIQTMFVKGFVNQQVIDNSTTEEVIAWAALVEKIQPKQVMIYTIERDTPDSTLQKVDITRLEAIAQLLRDKGFVVQVSG